MNAPAIKVLGDRPVNGWAARADEYLRLRHALGHRLDDAVRLLPRFVAHLDTTGATVITVEAALEWVQRPGARPVSSVWARRMTVVRGFARYMSGIDASTQVPPLGLVSYRRRWRPPFIYSPADVEALLAQVPALVPTPLRAATFQTIIGLLAATGMRVGEALRLDRRDIDWDHGLLLVRASKFGKSRMLPLHPTTVHELSDYGAVRDLLSARTVSQAFFLSGNGTPVIYSNFRFTFRRVVTASGVGSGSPVRPRIHDLRHSFAVHTLIGWLEAGEDIGALLPRLSTYLGHLTPGYTYWYLSAAPELLALAAARLETARGSR